MNLSSLWAIVLFLVFFLGYESEAWRTDRKPKVYGKSLHLKSLAPKRLKIRRRLVQYHNFFRTKVKPQASNMLAMTWSHLAAKDAQRWADACQLLVHDTTVGREVPNYGSCGQNIFVSTHKVPWFFALKTWWLEKEHFAYNGKNDLFVVGHYTQMVWASTHEVGCGLALCPGTTRPYYNYVCNYCPIGNHLSSLSKPYKRGRSCSGCKSHCKGRKLCRNSCPYGDLWMNCKELNETFPDWLCNTKNTRQGIDRLNNCKATCQCEGKIKFPYD